MNDRPQGADVTRNEFIATTVMRMMVAWIGRNYVISSGDLGYKPSCLKAARELADDLEREGCAPWISDGGKEPT